MSSATEPAQGGDLPGRDLPSCAEPPSIRGEAAPPRAARLRALLDAFLGARGRLEDNLERLAKGYGLCGSQVLVLLDVLAHPGTGLSGLCARTSLKKSAASKQVEALVGKGLLARARVEDDRRTLALSADRAMLEKGFCADSGIAAIFPGWKEGSPREDELDSILAALRRLSELLETSP
jgi:DNA-binding MarR family transcriptional regulator